MYRKALVAVVVAVVWWGGSRPALAQEIDPAFRAEVERLLEVTGAAKMGAQIATLVSRQIADTMMKSDPKISPRTAQVINEVVEAEFQKAFTAKGGLMADMVAIYARHLTPADVRELLAFYGSPIGRKMLEKQPVLIQEGAAAGQAWAARNMPRVQQTLQERLKAEGIIK